MTRERELAHEIIDLVETAIRDEFQVIDELAEKQEGNTLLMGEVYYNLEDKVVEKLTKDSKRLESEIIQVGLNVVKGNI